MQEEIENKSVVLTINAAKLTGRVLAKAMSAALRKMRHVHDAPKRGKQTVKQLAKQNSGLQNIEIADDNIKGFERIARKYGVDFALKRDDNIPPKWLVFFKSRDANALTAAFSEYSKDTIKRDVLDKPSVIAQIRGFKELVKNAVIQKPKTRERGGPEL